MVMVTTPAGLPRPLRSRFQRALRRRCVRGGRERRLAALADGELAADRPRQPGVRRGFDEQRARVRGAGPGVIKAPPVTDLGAQPHNRSGPPHGPPATAAQHVEHPQRSADHAAGDHLPRAVVEHRQRRRVRVQIVGIGDARWRIAEPLLGEPPAAGRATGGAGASSAPRPREVALAAQQERRQPCRARIKSARRSSRQRTRPRSCSCSSLGTHASGRSPAANSRARRIASRLSVLIRSPGRRSMLPGEQTAISTPSACAPRTSP